MTVRALCPLALVLLHACSGADETELTLREPLARFKPSAAGAPLAPFAPSAGVSNDGVEAGELEAGELGPSQTGRAAPGVVPTSNGSALDRGAPDAGAPPAPGDAGGAAPLPCLLRLEWTGLEASHESCQSLSGLPDAELAVWDGSRLTLLGAEWAIEENRLERTRRCRHQSGQLWRFAERLELARALPAQHCPDAAIEASYAYDECPLLDPGTVCAAGEPSACQLGGTLRLTPTSGDAAPALQVPELEASCRPVGRDPRQPIAPGERCYDGECSAGHFCSRELEAGTCAALGEGICTPAPSAPDCGDTHEDLCLCADPPMPLAALPPFDPTRPGALSPNTCTAHALGLSVIGCPPG